jgi:hypothetical protein
MACRCIRLSHCIARSPENFIFVQYFWKKCGYTHFKFNWIGPNSESACMPWCRRRFRPGVTRWACEKLAQNVAQPMFRQPASINVEKSRLKMSLGYFCVFQETVQRKQSRTGRKFAQSGFANAHWLGHHDYRQRAKHENLRVKRFFPQYENSAYCQLSLLFLNLHTGWPDWVNFRLLGGCLLWAVLWKLHKKRKLLGYFSSQYKRWINFD